MDQISGLPEWAKGKHFDIEAKLTDVDPKSADKMTVDQHRALLRALLVKRFGLKPTFVEMPASQLGKSVRDETGYAGKIDVDLKWAPDVSTHAPTDEKAALPPLPQALEKELGLHLLLRVDR